MDLEYRSCHWPGGLAGSPQCVRPMGYWFFPVPRPLYVCAVSSAAWLLFTGVPARFAVLRLRCLGPLRSCSPVCSLGVLCCVCGVLGHLAPVHRCASAVRCVASAVSWATWLLFTSVLARCVVLRVRCPGPLDSCLPVCPLGVLCCVCVVLTTWLLFTGALARGVVLLFFFFFEGGWAAAFLMLCLGVGVCRCRCRCMGGCPGRRGPGGCRALGSLRVSRPPGFRFPGRRSGGC